MRLRRSRSGQVTAILVGLAALLVGAAAFACTTLATISVDRDSAPVGDAVRIEGRGFGPAGTMGVTDVEIHLNGQTGPVVASAASDVDGHLSATLTVPQLAPGHYTLVAVRPQVGGEAARAVLQVVGPARQTAPAPVQAGSSQSGGTPGVEAVLLLEILGAAMAAVGAGALFGTRRDKVTTRAAVEAASDR